MLMSRVVRQSADALGMPPGQVVFMGGRMLAPCAGGTVLEIMEVRVLCVTANLPFIWPS